MNTLTIAPNHTVALDHARKHGFPQRLVITPAQIPSCKGYRYHGLHILDGVHLSQRQAYELTPCFLAAPDAEHIIPRIAALVPTGEGD